MFRYLPLFLTTVLVAPICAQQTNINAAPALELPVRLVDKVRAGKTPVGTQVRAKLLVGTLVNGRVIPEGAILSGRVEQSDAKLAESPSRLKICLDSAKWKNGSAPLKACLAEWTYSQDPGRRYYYGNYVPYAVNSGSSLDIDQRHANLEIAGQQARTAHPTQQQGPQRVRITGLNAVHASNGITLVSQLRDIKVDAGSVRVFEGESPAQSKAKP